jgi:hypothetical protein
MKSPDPLDPQRLQVTAATVGPDPDPDCADLAVTVTFRYATWWGGMDPDVLWEQSNALQCIREALQRGGVGHDF